MNDLMLIQVTGKSNLRDEKYFLTFLKISRKLKKCRFAGFGLLLLNFGINKGY
jgi:hypothetical protein